MDRKLRDMFMAYIINGDMRRAHEIAALMVKRFKAARMIQLAWHNVKATVIKKGMKRRMDIIREELMAATWAPKRMAAWCLPYDDEFHSM